MLSTTVAEAFAYENSPHTKETERFVRIFDKFFDLMNTRNTKEFVYKRKPNLAPYINNPETEERLKVNCMHKFEKKQKQLWSLYLLSYSGCRMCFFRILMSGKHMLMLKSI